MMKIEGFLSLKIWSTITLSISPLTTMRHHARKCHQCQVHGNAIHALAVELRKHLYFIVFSYMGI
ncbi:reverse transcriptase [Gossypium australe]|uniref:Reverse transcriptase n=1 Tax=Gossypium australe TaxID=47621 RepID=A0A5B6WGS1_9ROSI|nr:reverse transcriptase [Gossypium australe]